MEERLTSVKGLLRELLYTTTVLVTQSHPLLELQFSVLARAKKKDCASLRRCSRQSRAGDGDVGTE